MEITEVYAILRLKNGQTYDLCIERNENFLIKLKLIRGGK